MKRTIYRDRRTGRFVSKSTWKRSHAQGSTRYVRTHATAQRVPRGVTEAEIERELEREELDIERAIESGEFEEEKIEYQGAFDTPTGRGKR